MSAAAKRPTAVKVVGGATAAASQTVAAVATAEDATAAAALVAWTAFDDFSLALGATRREI